ncbi:MAG: hypothetical protein ACI4RL_04015, partial [Ruminococcus sp.]
MEYNENTFSSENPVEKESSFFDDEPAENEEKITKKKKKPFFKRTGGIVLIVVLVVLIGGGITAFALRHQILKAVLGPVDYYLFEEGYNLYELSGEDIGLSGDFTVGKDFSSIVSFTGADSAKIGVDIQYSPSQDKLKSSFDLLGILLCDIQKQGDLVSTSVNNQDPVVTDMSGKSINGANSKSTKSRNNKTKTTTETKASEEKEELSTWDLLTWAYSFSKDCLASPLEDGYVTEAKEEYRGVECDTTTFKITGDSLSEIYKNIADSLENDERTQIVFEKVYSGYLEFLWEEGFDKDKAVETFREMSRNAKEDKSMGVNYTVYYDGSYIMKREFERMSLATYEENDKTYVELDIPKTITGIFEYTDTVDVSDVNIKKENAVSDSGNTVVLSVTKALLGYAFELLG